MSRPEVHIGPRRKAAVLVVGVLAAATTLAACGSSSSSTTTSQQNASASSAAPKPATSFSTATIAGLGSVVVGGNRRTVYILTSGGHTNLPCTDASGCTKVWPDLPLPGSVAAAKAGTGIQASLLGTKKLSDGETYPTYNGWLMYEYAADSGPGQANGQGIQSFGGTWYVLSSSGNPITTTAGAASGGGSGY
jgi:predicted lipoprotein with Yx(FWY)xxD motif